MKIEAPSQCPSNVNIYHKSSRLVKKKIKKSNLNSSLKLLGIHIYYNPILRSDIHFG
jgi:hypothetical protein